MSDNTPTIKYPATTDEVAKMLNFTSDSSDSHEISTDSSSHGQPPADLPGQDNHQQPSVDHTVDNHTAPASHHDEPKATKANSSKTVAVAKAIAPYLAIFAIGLFLYYFFFSSVNFNSLFSAKVSVPSTPQENALQQLEKQDAIPYNAWIAGYYYDVTDANIIAPDTDNSGNGLSNFQKYLLGLNPKSYDTLGLGIADSQAIAQGIDPSTGGPISPAKQAIINKYIDMEVVMNRLTLAQLQNPSPDSLQNSNQPTQQNPRGNSTNNYAVLPVISPIPVTSQTFNSPTTGANLNPATNDNSTISGNVNINTNVPGSISIPDLKLTAPIIWSTSPDNFETDLEQGVIHYPGTAMPGQIGTTYIAGHSSNYVWAKGNYNDIFTVLNNLPNNASFTITVTQTNGKPAIFHYVVVSRQQFSPTDPAQIANTGKSLVALSTCWPINSTAKRLVLYGQLTQVEQ